MSNTVQVYTDGSFDGVNPSWAFLIVQDNKVIFKNRGILDKYLDSYQIGGECEAVIQALKYCKGNNLKAEIFYDYIGVLNWVADIIGMKNWKTNKEVSQNYRAEVLKYKDYIINFIKVKAHSGDYFNEMVDKFTRNELDDDNVTLKSDKPSSGIKYNLGFCFDENFNYLVLIHKNNKIPLLAGLLNGVGGKGEENEPSEVAMAREFKEECGLEVNKWSKFAELISSDGGFIEVFSANIPYFSIVNAASLTNEKVEVIRIRDESGNFIFQQNFAHNLPWLIPMAYNNETKLNRFTYKIQETKE